jgi:hypothetical protein
MRDRSWQPLLLIAALAGCASGITPQSPPESAAPPEGPPVSDGAPDADDDGGKPGQTDAGPGGRPGYCDVQHVFDEATKDCRLFPGGGNGWAGCSMSTKPPNDERCVTGTHWEKCDCVCDAQGKRFNLDTRACE